MKRLWFLVIGFIFLLTPMPVSAAGVSYEISSSYTLEKDTVKVTHEVTFAGANLGDQTLTVPGSSEKFSVSGGIDFEDAETKASANGVPFTATDLTLKLGSKTSETVTIKYSSSDLHAEYEQADSVFVPPFDLEGEIEKQSVSITAPLDIEIGNVIGAEVSDATTVGGEQTYSFVQDKAYDSPIILQLGSSTVADVIIKSKLENKGFWWKTKSVVLPLDTNQQRSFVTSIEPKPTAVRVDIDGNIIAEYSLRPQQTVNVTAKATVAIEQKVYDLENESGFQQIEQDLISDYTSSTDLWPTSVLDSLDLNAETIREKSVLAAVEQINNALVKVAPAYDSETDFSKRTKNEELETWTSVDCADRMIAALRATGIPARMVGGVITDNQLTVFETPQKAAWVEAYVPDIGWITVDPVLGKLSDNFFGQAGLQKVGYFIWGVSDRIPEFQNDEVTVSYSSDTLPDDSFKNKQVLSGQNFILLPGVSVLRSVATMPKGIIHDEVSIRALGAESQLGSLAPLQERQTLRFIIGDKSWQNVPMTLAVAGDVVGKATANLNYMLVVAEVLLLGLVVWFMLKWRKKRRAPIVLHDDDSKDYVIEGQDLLHGRSQNESERPVDPLRDDVPPGP
jgi:hypothetical protein